MFVVASHIDPSLMFTNKAGAYPSGALIGHLFKGGLLVWPTNIRLGTKYLAVSQNTTALVTAVKKFYSTVPMATFRNQPMDYDTFKILRKLRKFCHFESIIFDSIF